MEKRKKIGAVVGIISIHAASSRLVCEEAVGRDDETVAP